MRLFSTVLRAIAIGFLGCAAGSPLGEACEVGADCESGACNDGKCVRAEETGGGGWSDAGTTSTSTTSTGSSTSSGTGGSFGAQIGLQAIDLVLVINNERGLQRLVSNQFKVGADAGVAAGPVGRDASASTDIQMRAQILSYSRSRGLFAGVTLNGSTIRQDRDANERYYGTAYRTGQIVFDGLGGSPSPVGDWKATLTKHAR